MSSDFFTYTLPLFGIIVAGDVVTGYAAYLALSVWRGLAVPIYRSRALWTGVLATLFVLTAVFAGNVDALVPAPYLFVASIVINYGLYNVVLVALFVWIDRTIGTLVRLDYLRRDLLRWKSFRFVYWGSVLVSLASYYGYNSILIMLISAISLLVPIAYGSLALVVGSSRTRDMTFRSHAKWGGYLMLFVIAATLAYFATPSVVIQDLWFLPISYCFYKMAKFLVPIGTFTAPEVSM
jgi:hypothetical protein